MSNANKPECIIISTAESFQNFLDLIKKLEIPKLAIGTDRLIIELMWTNALQEFLDFANQNVFQSFHLRLIEE